MKQIDREKLFTAIQFGIVVGITIGFIFGYWMGGLK